MRKKLKIKTIMGVSDFDLTKLGNAFDPYYGSGYFQGMNDFNKFLGELSPEDFIDIKFDRNYYEKTTQITLIYSEQQSTQEEVEIKEDL